MIYAITLLGGLAVVHSLAFVSVSAAFLLLTFATIGASAFLLIRLKPSLRLTAVAGMFCEVRNKHWTFGRWELVGVGVQWIVDNVVYALTAVLLGLHQVGVLKAIANVMLPVPQVVLGLCRVAQPYVARISGRHGRSATSAPVKKITLLTAMTAFVCCAIIVLFSAPILRTLYGPDFTGYAYLVPFTAVYVVFFAAADALCLGLRAIQSPSSVVVARAFAGIVLVIAGIVATRILGLPGMILAGILASIAMLIAAAVLFQRRALSAVSA